MTDYEKQFEQIVNGLNIDDRPNAEHKKALRQQMLAACKESSSKTTAVRIQPVWSKIMKSTITKTAAAAVIFIAAVLSLTVWETTIPTATASEVLTCAIQAVQNIHSIYIKAKMRTLPQDNFMYLNLDLDFVPIEMWKKQCDDGQLRLRIDKPRRQVVFDNTSATMIINHNYVVQGRHGGSYGSFDCEWLSRLLQVDDLLRSELESAQNDANHEISVYHQQIEGRQKLVVERFSKANVSKDDYLRNKFIQDADRTFIYYFEPNTKFLEGLQVLVHTDDGDVLALEITDIQYNIEIADERFALEIPQDAVYSLEPQVLPDNEKYANMTPKEAARIFFTACARENWDEFLKFWITNRVDDRIKQHLGGMEIVSLGEPFQSEGYGGWFVPYEIKLKNGSIKKHNLALRNDNPAKRWVVDGGI